MVDSRLSLDSFFGQNVQHGWQHFHLSWWLQAPTLTSYTQTSHFTRFSTPFPTFPTFQPLSLCIWLDSRSNQKCASSSCFSPLLLFCLFHFADFSWPIFFVAFPLRFFQFLAKMFPHVCIIKIRLRAEKSEICPQWNLYLFQFQVDTTFNRS